MTFTTNSMALLFGRRRGDYTETRKWLEEQAGKAQSPVASRRVKIPQLITVFESLGLSDEVALEFCRNIVLQHKFWLELDLLEEKTTGGDPFKNVTTFISSVREGKRTIFLNRL